MSYKIVYLAEVVSKESVEVITWSSWLLRIKYEKRKMT
jgi:hypothetical protein